MSTSRYYTAEFINRVRETINVIAPRVVAWLNDFAAATKDAAASLNAQDASNAIVTLLDEIAHLKEWGKEMMEQRDYHMRTSDNIAANQRKTQAELNEKRDELQVANSVIEAMASERKTGVTERERTLNARVNALAEKLELEYRAHEVTKRQVKMQGVAIQEKNDGIELMKNEADAVRASFDNFNAQLKEKDATIEKLRKLLEVEYMWRRLQQEELVEVKRELVGTSKLYADYVSKAANRETDLMERIDTLKQTGDAAASTAKKYGVEADTNAAIIQGVRDYISALNEESMRQRQSSVEDVPRYYFNDGKQYALNAVNNEINRLQDSYTIAPGVAAETPPLKGDVTVITTPEQESTPSRNEHIAFMRDSRS